MRGAEPLSRYQRGGYHPVHLGDKFHENRYLILHKLGWGSYATVWLARDCEAPGVRYVALKFIVAQLVHASNEIDILRHLRNELTKNPGGFEHILGFLDCFKVSGPNGIHDVIVLDVVGPSPDELREGNEEGETFVWKHAKVILKQALTGIAYIHKLGITHGDLHGSNIAFSLPQLDRLSESAAMGYLKPPCRRPVPADADVSSPKYLVEASSFKNYMLEMIKQDDTQYLWSIKILDFGEAFLPEHRPREIHTPLGIRAPEIVFNVLSAGALEQDWGSKTDIWSFGCLIYEIVTDDSLISLYDDDVNDVCTQYVRKVGPLPERWQGIWSGSKKALKFRPFERYLKSHYLEDYRELTGDDMIDLGDLLRQILVLDPRQRSTARELLQHRWFATV
ncbi:Serine/threonine-protein kinase SRPK [Grifola frondosa]|uniref:non-specific serine/threonine protein kinase n=1 Tax=Grifola frondosa TaxID=5627 RepID=A0A1C7MAP8_GRIFR|nr:Serine/threonine-protein kinase SRPK [Grifola frondosa]